MKERLVIWFAGSCLFFLLPYGLTVLLSGSRDTWQERAATPVTEKRVAISVNGEYQVMDAEEYIAGVLPDQIPMDYHPEALKAQAVIIRTKLYCLMGEDDRIDGEDLPFTYIPEEERKSLWGERYWNSYQELCKTIVETTRGQTLNYQGEYIEPLFHQVSIGTTIDAAEWGNQQAPYLKAAESGSDISAGDYMQIVVFSSEELEKRLGVSFDEARPMEERIAIVKKTEHGYVTQVQIGETKLTGEEIQERLDLHSTNFGLEVYEGQYRFVCLGKGHGMGLSQYGANVMAKEGKNYEEILKHYYTGVALSSVN